MLTELSCWFDFEDGRACMLPNGHAGPHEPISDYDIIIRDITIRDIITEAPE